MDICQNEYNLNGGGIVVCAAIIRHYLGGVGLQKMSTNSVTYCLCGTEVKRHICQVPDYPVKLFR